MRYGKDLIAMVGLLAVCATQDLWAQSNDVYNFYFQKGSAPNSVTQGGAGQQAATPLQPPQTIPSQLPTEPPAHVDNVVVAKTTPPPEPEKPVHDYKRFDLLLGVTRVNDDLGTGAAYTFGGQYNFSRYLGVRAQGQLLAVESANYHFPIVNRDDGSNKWGGQAAFVFTPLHMELLGHQLLKVSALGGIMSVRHLGDFNSLNNEFGVRRGGLGFWGAAAQMTLNENIGVEGSIAMTDGGKVSQATADLVFNF